MTGDKRPNFDNNFYRNLRKYYPTVDRGEGVYIWDMDRNNISMGREVRALCQSGMESRKFEKR